MGKRVENDAIPPPEGRVNANRVADLIVLADGRLFLVIQSEDQTLAGGRNMLKLTFNWFEDLKATLSTSGR